MDPGRAEEFLLLFEGNHLLGIIQLKPKIVGMLVREAHIDFIRLSKVPEDLLWSLSASPKKCVLGLLAPRFVYAYFRDSGLLGEFPKSS